MPTGDGTGPWGMGPMTGRMSGYCAGYGMPGYEYPISRQGFRAGFGQGIGFGRGRGCGWRFMDRAGRFFSWMPYERGDAAFDRTPSLDTEKRFLQTRAEVLQRQIDGIKQRLDELADYEAQ